MKTSQLIFALLLSGPAAFAAQTIEKDLGTFGNWKSAQIKSHDLLQKDACLSFTKANESASTLEIYAEKETAGTAYVEPTVLLVSRAETGFVRGILTDDSQSEQIHLMLASTSTQPIAFGLIARMDDRQKLVALIKRANTAKVQLINEKNKVVKTLNFSLKGSSKATDALFAGCGLTFEN